MAGYIHWTVCKHTGLQVTDRFYERISERVINVNGTTIMWNVPVITDRTILVNRPDIALHDTEKDAIPDDSNLNKTTKQMRNLEIEVSRMWKVRTKLCQL